MTYWFEHQIDADARIAALAAQLVAARATGVLVRRVEARFSDGSYPEPQSCHANAARFIGDHEGASVVPGWLPFDYITDPLFAMIGVPPRYEFLSHSVVRLANGDTIDVTPARQGAGTYRFIRHPGTDQDFADLISKPVVRIISWARPPRITYSAI